jgi:hypothetical protein
MLRAATLYALLILVFAAPAAAAVDGPAPGAPGQKAVWTEADKDGFGTATSLRNRT